MDSITFEGMVKFTVISRRNFFLLGKNSFDRKVSKKEEIRSNKIFSSFHSFALAISSNLTIIVHNI